MSKNEAVDRVLAENLLSLRGTQGLTRRALAEKAGIHEDVLQKVEMGQRRPNLNTLISLADALDVDVSTLLAAGT